MVIAPEARVDDDPLAAELRPGPSDDLFLTDACGDPPETRVPSSSSARRVSGPHIPSGARPISFWKELSPACVRGPKYPSTRST